jgi:uncharacterized membrane protein YcaP (DUF421 family)
MSGILFGINPHDLIVPGIGIIEKIVRPVIIYFILIIGLRLAGKREMAQLNPFDMVVLFSLTNAVQNAIIGNDNSLSGGIIGAATLLVLNYFVVKLIYGNRKIRHLFEGEPDVLISDGKIRMDRLKKEMITIDEMVEAAHKQGIDSLSEVKKAVIDPDGVISFVKNDPTPDIIRHDELTKKLNALCGDIAAIKKEMGIRGNS